MQNYLGHLNSLYNNKTFLRKKEYIKHNFSKVVKHLNSKSHVLEIGPGMGEFVSSLNEYKIYNIDVLDADKHVLKNMSDNFKVKRKIKSFLGDKFKLTILQKYDVIFMMQIFEHITKSSYINTITQLFNHLKPGGSLIITVPNGANPFNIGERYADLQHEAMFTEISLKELPYYCDLTNFTLEVQPYLIPPSSPINIIRIFMQAMLHFLIRLIFMINGGIYQTILTPQITLVITRKR